MRDFVPYASDYDTYGLGPEYNYYGPDSYQFNYTGQAPANLISGPAAPSAPMAPSYSFEPESGPAMSDLGAMTQTPGSGLGAVTNNARDFLGHVMSGIGLVSNPAVAVPTMMASLALDGRFNTSPLNLASRALTGQGILGNIGELFGNQGGFDPVTGMAPGERSLGIDRTVESGDLGAPPSTSPDSGSFSADAQAAAEQGGYQGSGMYAEGGHVNAFLGGFFDDLISGIGNVADSAGDWVSNTASNVGDWISGAGNGVLQFFQDPTSVFDPASAANVATSSSNLPPLGDPIHVPTLNVPVPAIDPAPLATAAAAATRADEITSMLQGLGIQPVDPKPSWLSRNKWPLLGMAGVLGANILNRRKAMPKSVLQGVQNNITYGPSLPQVSFNRRMGLPSRDPRTAGYVGERDYFSDNALPMSKAEGGGVLNHFASGTPQAARYVKGPGDGREDKIPAYLSNDEYVIDAETVALLGNGSPEHGARKLDDMRKQVRRHKGKALAQGRFSPDAKHPMEYVK